jgi:NADP-dependent 3-hydroxy acid dehydrogenase YdfG
MNRIQGKTVLVTGASSGIGKAVANQLASRGADLILLARREERLLQLKISLEREFGISVRIASIDVRDRAAVQAFCAELERDVVCPDVLVNNAGLASGLSKLQEGDHGDWDRMIDTNIKGLLNVSRCIIPMMVKNNRGHIVNIGSTAGHMVYPRGNVYNATKFAVRALNEGMNIDLLGTRIRVSSIDPGATKTEFSKVRFHGDSAKAEAVYTGFKPLSGDDIADAICYVINTPEHVNVLDMVILPTAQRNPYVLHRDDE